MADWERAGGIDDGWERPSGNIAPPVSMDGWERPKEKKLFSAEGVMSTLKLVGPGLATSILGAQLAGLEEVQSGREARRAKGENLPVTPDEEDTIRAISEKRRALQEGFKDIEEIRGKPSYPLEIAQGVVQSVAQNLPGVAVAATTRNMTGAIPALQAAQTLTEGQTYAEGRVQKGAPQQEALVNAKVSGVTEAAFELLPTAYLVKNLGKEGFQKFIGQYVLREWGTELPTTLAQDVSEWATVEKDKPIGKFVHDTLGNLLDTALITPFAAGATGSIAHGIAKAGGRQEQEWERPGVKRDDNIPLSAPLTQLPEKPLWDHPTTPLDSRATAEVQALIDSIDAELIDDKQVAEAKTAVAKFQEVQKAPIIPEAKTAWKVLDIVGDLDTGELGASRKQEANVINYINPNTAPREERPILIGPEGTIGLTPQQHVPQAATYVIGEATEDRSYEYLKSLYDTYEQWRSKYIPGSTIVISNEQLPFSNALGWHYSESGTHIIVPAVLRSPSKGLSNFNANTQASAFYNATHEFGHALIEDRFFEGVDQLQQNVLRKEAKEGLISETTISALPETQQAVVKEYNALKAKILDGTMSASEFVNSWMSPGKAGRKSILEGVDPLGPAQALLNKIAQRAAYGYTGSKNPVALAPTIKKISDSLLSLDEYLAEQTARYAYKTKWDQTSPLGQFFKKALDSLRAFFTEQKRDGIIAPGTAFTQWIEGLTATEQITNGEEQKAIGKKGRVKVVAKEKVKTAPAKRKVERLQHNVETSTDEAKEKEGKDLIFHLLERGKLSVGSPDAKKLLELLAQKDYDEFIDLYKKLEGKKVQFELKEPGGMWDEKTITALSEALLRVGGVTPDYYQSRIGWAKKAVQNYLNKYAATARDPLRDIMVPHQRAEETWGKLWENATGSLPVWLENNNTPGSPTLEEYLSAMPERFKKAQPSEPIYSLKFQTIKEGAINPIRGQFAEGGKPSFHVTSLNPFEYNIARSAIVNYLSHVGDYLREFVSDTDLSRYDLVRAVRETSAQDERQKAKMAKARAENKGTTVQKEYPDGFKWVKVESDEALKNEGDIMGHCVGGYCEAVHKGRSEIYSLRDKAGFSHVTIEVKPLSQKIKDAQKAGNKDAFDFKPAIIQIKGKQNRAPIDTYVPYAQDFIKSSQWAFVGDLQNAQMVEVERGKYITLEENKQLGYRGHFELDTPDSPEQVQFLKGIRNFMNDPAPLRRALRKFQGAAYWALQIQQLSHLNPDLTDLAAFNEFNTRYNTRKASLQATPDEIASAWSDLSETNFFRVNKFLLDELDGGTLWFTLQNEETGYSYQINATTVAELSKRGIDITTEEGQDLVKLILDVKNDLLTKMGEKEKTMQLLLAHRFAGGGPEVLKAAMIPLKKTFQDMRKVPFFPQGRFGNLMLIIERQKESGGFEVVYREAFEKRADWEKAWKEADAKKKPDERVQAKELTDQQYVLMSLPTDFIDLAASELGLSAEQVDQLLSILQPIKAEKALRSYDINRLGIKGYSTDALRSYANFSWHDANLIAKLEYRAKFNLAIRGIGAKLREAQFAGPQMEGEVFRLTRVKAAMERSRDYIMSPPNEAQMLRGIVSVLYLGLNVKTALINFYGLVTTWSDITSRKGLIEGSAAMAKATAGMFKTIKLTNLNERRQGNYLPEETQKALDLALEEGVLSQSYAYHLAGVANASNLFRLPSRQLAGRVAKKSIDLAMWPFRLTELGTRRVSFITEFTEARKPGVSFQEAYDIAVARTNALQNDYSLGNRVPFMRGISTQPGNPLAKVVEPIIPLATIFMSFAQHMAFHGYGGYEIGERRAQKLIGETPRSRFGAYTMKIWIITLLLAGYEGLPGAENLLDLLEAAWRKFGGAKPIRQELREFIQSIESVDLDPQLFSRGLGHNVAGFDVSRSLGFGRMVPGTSTLAHPGDSLNETIGSLTLDMLGATGGIIKFGLEATFGKKPPAETFQKLPGGIGNIYTAYYWSKHGVRAPTGALVTHDLTTGALRDLTSEEIFGKALGFNPTIVSENREIRFNQYDRKVYWQARRQHLLEDLWRTKWQKDEKAEEDVKKAVQEYNAGIPEEYKQMRLTGADIAKSMQARRRTKQADEKQQPTQKRYRGLYEDVKKSYE